MQSIFIPSQQNNKVNANTKQSKIKQQKTGYQSVKRKNSVIQAMQFDFTDNQNYKNYRSRPMYWSEYWIGLYTAK